MGKTKRKTESVSRDTTAPLAGPSSAPAARTLRSTTDAPAAATETANTSAAGSRAKRPRKSTSAKVKPEANMEPTELTETIDVSVFPLRSQTLQDTRSPRGPQLTHEDEAVWEDMARMISSTCRAPRVGNTELAMRGAEISGFRIGWALLRFAGVGGVEGMVTLSEDPNDRHNPRELQDTHVEQLAQVFMTGGKRDFRSPIRVMLPRSCISAELEAQMRNVDINDPATTIPQLLG
ncbi:hypothetical protein FRC06_008007 [Ceratobasidium sp. 370]|nr:hypothetical protein FRC06_008007 [Ceratobasidium sp. 370]